MSKQRFSIAFDFEANMGSIISSVANLKKELSGVNLPSNFAANFKKLFGNLESEMSNFQAMTKNGFNNMADVKKAEASFSKISRLFNQISLESSKIKGIDPNKLLPKELQTRTANLKKKLGELQDQQNKKNDYVKKIEKQNEAIKKQQRELQNLETARKALEDDAKSLGGQKGAATKRRNEAQSNLDAATAKRDKLIAEGAKASNPALQAAKKDVDTYAKTVRDAQAQIDALSNKLNTNTTAMRANSASTEIAERELADLKAQLTQMQNVQVDSQALTALREELAKIQGVGIDQISTDLQEIDIIIDRLDAKELEEIVQKMQKINTVTNQTDDAFEQARQEVKDFTNTADGLDRTAQDMQNLQRQVQDFFSITNSIQLFKRAVTSALNTVKELDATMTEAAVVTEFDVGDMWDKLPQYSANAQKLGVSINGMYQATTLYYQQGLKTNEAMQVGIETMKMAKIAGMDSAQATEAMTAALRGFNMELNETSATKVNDVYSQLAAVTAADTEQIATAMEKTASIAASANMEFETTAALLAQIIETTQEAPETAGTAMKTIIARFAEVKKIRDQGQMTGTDSEGESIDVNKIQAALKTVGISMDGFFAGTEGLDSVLLKLADKWDTLDFETQRYIATMAAGSRQQSRFIAMMSDYGRTTELVGEAQNSAGASQRQFEKTQDSLEVKLQKLKNAWDQFLMGLSNNEAIKFAVDALTKILEGINGIIDGISGGNGLIKTITSLVGVIGALKLGQGIFGGKALGGIGGFLGKMTGQSGTVKETITETKGPGDSIVRTIVKEPVKEGEQAGQQAGHGFVAGFKRAVSAGKEGVGLKGQLGAMFTTGQGKEVTSKDIGGGAKRAKRKQAKNQKKIQNAKTTILAGAYDANQENLDFDPSSIQKLEQVYDDMIAKGGSAKDAANAVNAELENMGLTTAEIGPEIGNVNVGLENATLDMNAMGQAAMGVGAALGGLSAIFSALGMEEEAEAVSKVAAVFMGLGTIMSTLSSIAPMLGMSFTTAGVQITTAGVTSQLAWWWVFLIIAAVAALAIGIVALAKAAEASSLEARMEAAAQATEDAKAAAESAKQAYDDLLSARSEYNELQNTLEGLTKGTDEWKQALIEANSQVLELLTTYPELAKYIGRGEDGQLTISTEGWDTIINNQQKKVKNAQMATQASAMDETRLQQEQAKTTYESEAYKKGLTKVVSYGDSAQVVTDTIATEKLFNAYKENGAELFKIEDPNADLSLDSSYSDALQKLAKQTGQTAQELYNMKDALAEYDSALLANETQLKAQAEATLMAGASQETTDYKYGDDVVSGFAGTMASEAYQKREAKIADDLYNKDGSAESESNENFKALAKEYNVTNEMVGDDLEDLKTLYAAMAGIAKDDIPDGIAEDKKRLAEEIAKMQAGKEHTDMMEKFRKKMETMDAKDQKAVASLISGDSSNLTLGELKGLQGKTAADYAKKMGYNSAKDMAKGMGYEDMKLSSLSAEDRKAYLDKQIASGAIDVSKIADAYKNTDGTLNYEAYANAYGTTTVNAEVQFEIDNEQAKEKMQQAYDDATEELSKKTGLSKDEIADKFANTSIGAIEGISKQISKMSKESANAYVNAWEDTISNSNLGNTEKEQLENYLSNVDWSNMTEATEAMDYMQSKGIDSSKIESFWNAATNGAGTYVNSLNQALQLTERLQNKIASINDIVERLADGKGTYEDVMKMVEAGVNISKFQLTDEGWKASDADLATGKAKLSEHYAAQAQADYAQHVKEVEKAKKLDTGFTINEDGTISKTKDFFITRFTNQDTNGKLVAGKIEYEVQADTIAKKINEATKQDGESREEYIARVQKAYEDYINLINNGDEIGLILDKTAIYSELQAAQANLDAGAKQATDSWSRWQKILKSDDESEKSKALNEMREAAKRLLNTEADLSDSFLENAKNQELMKKAAKGNKEALNELQKAAAEDIFNKLGKDGKKALGRLKDDIKDVADTDIEVGVTVTINDNDPNQSIANKLTDMYNEAYNAAIKGGKEVAEAEAIANNLIASQGFKAPEMVEEETTVIGDIPPGIVAKGAGWVPGPNGEPVQGYNFVKQDNGQYQYTYTRLVPKQDTGFTKVSESVGGGGKKGGGGGGGSGSKYENSHDKFYNTYEKINALLREREKIERRYQKLLKKRSSSGKDLVNNAKEQLELLKQEEKQQQYLQNGKLQEIKDLMTKNSKYSKYVTGFDQETGAISINWDAINAIKSEKTGQAVDDYLSKLEELRDQWQEAQDALDEIEDTTEEIYEQGKDEYFDIEDRIKEAIVQQRQDEIDKLSEINDSINDTNSKILDSMQEQIDEYRQNRDNEKTEEEIADKQRRLAYLQQDTSGANATEILNLQKEIDEAQEDYTDTLIDQKISELQEQNDKAAEQRQQQIDLMQAWLDHYQESGAIWQEVYDLWDSGISADGVLLDNSRLLELLKESDEFQGLSKLGQSEWMDELRQAIIAGFQYINFGRRAKEGDTVTFTTASGDTITGTADKNGNIITDNGAVYEDVHQDKEGNWSTTEKTITKPTNDNKKEGAEWNYSYPKPSTGTKQLYKGDNDKKAKSDSEKYVSGLQQALNDLGYRTGKIDGVYGNNTLKAVKKFQTDAKKWYPDIGKANGYVGPKTREAFRLKGYETGGLADFTGPAWLDGTKAKPEYILNADQTKAFFNLIDVLGSLQSGNPKASQNNGDTSFDIDINVESIGSDYDVEQMAETIKRLINEDARYRNNNAINLMR